MATKLSDDGDRAAKARAKRSADLRTALYFMLHGFAFVGSTLLMTWGLFVLFFLALGGFSFDGSIHQLNNFTTRYVAADEARTSAFVNMFAIAHMILSTGVITFRRDKILPERERQGAHRHG